MTTQPTLSLQKIIFLVVFISAALITSLFVFHLREQKKQAVLTSEHAIIFPHARAIKPFELVDQSKQVFTQKNLLHHWTLLFFGFTHCPDICPTTLAMLKDVYTPLKKDYPDLQVVLVTLDPNRDTTDALSRYTTSFHQDFIGITGKLQDIRKLQSQLGVYSAEESNHRIQHTASIFLVNPEGKWAGLFNNDMKADTFRKVFTTSTRASL